MKHKAIQGEGMGYASPPSIECIHVPGIREGVYLVLVHVSERVQCPTWSERANMTTAKKYSGPYRFFEANHYHRRNRNPKSMVPSADKIQNGKKNIFSPRRSFFLLFFQQPLCPGESRREIYITVGTGTVITWLCVSTDLSDSTINMSAWRATEIFTIATIFANNRKIEISKWRAPGGKPTTAVLPAHILGVYRLRRMAK